MKTLRYILEVDNTDYDKNRTSDPMSKPKKKKNVLFIGDANTKSANSYARQIINSGIVTGEVRASFEGTAQEILKLVRAHNADNYNIVSIQYSNIFPKELNNDIDALSTALSTAKQYGAKVILISNPAKDHVPYGHVKYESDLDIWNWITKQQNESDYTIDIRQITNNETFFEKNGLLFNKDTQNIITKLWLDVLKDIDPDVDTKTIKKQDQRKLLNKQKTNKKWNYNKGQKYIELIPIQKRLERLGYDIQDSEIGSMNDSTIEAIKKFQMMNSLAVTGQLSNDFVTKLNSPAAIEYSDWKYALKNIIQPDAEEDAEIENVTDDYQSSGGSYNIYTPAGESYNTTYDAPVTTQAKVILRREESFSSTPGWDVNNWRVGFGSSTITKPDGSILKLSANKSDHPNIKISVEDAERDLERRVRDEFIPRTIKNIGPVAADLNNGTIAALTSVTYNYGSLPMSVVEACQTKDVNKIAQAVQNLSANKKRRIREANWIVGSSTKSASATKTSNLATSKNGKLSNAELKSIGHGEHRLEPNAANAFLEMEKAANAAGITFNVTDSYRTLAIQNAIFDWDYYNKTGKNRKKGTAKTAAAVPGTSNHGWGKAIDVFPTEAQTWIKTNGEQYGWSWAEGRSVGEPWHFTYIK
jgi:LAS superfamily LD-carboxypeptidase LdcB